MLRPENPFQRPQRLPLKPEYWDRIANKTDLKKDGLREGRTFLKGRTKLPFYKIAASFLLLAMVAFLVLQFNFSGPPVPQAAEDGKNNQPEAYLDPEVMAWFDNLGEPHDLESRQEFALMEDILFLDGGTETLTRPGD